MRRAAGATLLVAVLPGCSWLFVESPPVHHERLSYFDCTESRAAPIVDTALAVAYGLSGLVGLAAGVPGAHGETDGFGSDNIAMFAVSAAAATGFGLSAGYGFGATADCDQAKAKWAQRVLERPPPPPAQPPPPPGPALPRPCGSDADCAGDRICEQGACTFPPVPPVAPTAAPPAAPPPTEVR